MSGAARAQAILDRMDKIDALESNLLRVSPAFRIRLIVADPDDDKFADCAVAAEADYLITEDPAFRCPPRLGLQAATHLARGIHPAIPAVRQ